MQSFPFPLADEDRDLQGLLLSLEGLGQLLFYLEERICGSKYC